MSVVGDEALGNRQHGRRVGNVGEHLLHEPVHAEAVHAADDHVGPFERFGELLEIEILDACGKRLVEFRMLARPLRFGDNLPVQMRAGQPDAMAVFPCGKGQCRPHHTDADGRNVAHDDNCFNFPRLQR